MASKKKAKTIRKKNTRKSAQPTSRPKSISEKALQAAITARFTADSQYEAALERVRQEQLLKSEAKATAAAAKRTAAVPAREPLRILAEGDSWFRYACGVGVITQLESKLSGKAIITNVASGGDTMQEMLTLPAKAGLETRLRKGLNGRPWNAVLFSGGGNDFCGKKFYTWLLPFAGRADPAAAIDRSTWEPKLNEMAGLFKDLSALVATHVPGAPVHLNLYDFAIPNNKGAGPAGPWLAPGFKKRGYPADLGFRTAVVRLMLQEFAAMVETVAESHSNLRLVATQGTLGAHEWANELHPKNPGFGKIANLFAAAV
jgi:hypothetical protein